MLAIRGATTVERDSKEEIFAAVQEMLQTILEKNELTTEHLTAALFTVTDDLHSVFPAAAARDLGWDRVPLLDAMQPEVEGSLKQCIRVMLFYSAPLQKEVQHVYLRGARSLRPDLVDST